MTPAVRKFALTAHITSSVGWLGAVAGFEALAVAGLVSRDAQLVRAAYLAMQPIAWFVIVPFAFVSLLTGLVVSLGSKWGLFRHYWILAKFLINALAIIILLLHTQLISYVASAAAEKTLLSEDLRGPRIQLVAVAGAALLALLVATTLAVFKPRGMTPFGQRKQQEERGKVPQLPRSPQALRVTSMSDPGSQTVSGGLSLGLKIALGIVGVIVAVIVVLHLTGRGVGMHDH